MSSVAVWSAASSSNVGASLVMPSARFLTLTVKIMLLLPGGLASSLAVTSMPSDASALPGVPENVRVPAVNVSHAGRSPVLPSPSRAVAV